MKNGRTKTYEEFRDELKDRNFLILSSDILVQLRAYSGAHNHSAITLRATLQCWIDPDDKVNLEGTVQEVLFSGKKYAPDESLLKAMYERWQKGIYSV